MGIHSSPPPRYWNYYLALESDVTRLSRFVEFTDDNFAAYSMEMVKILLSAGSEVDVVAKKLCKVAKPDSKASNIEHYRKILSTRFETLPEFQVSIPRYGLTLTPWENWQNKKNPNWWKEHNAVKHERHDSYKLANLSNVLNTMAGLLVLIYFYNVKSNRSAILSPSTSLFLLREFEMQGLDY
jgi:hypothetical protein